MRSEINYQYEWIIAVSEALLAKDIDRLEELGRLSDGWMSTADERTANQLLIQAALSIAYEG